MCLSIGGVVFKTYCVAFGCGIKCDSVGVLLTKKLLYTNSTCKQKMLINFLPSNTSKNSPSSRNPSDKLMETPVKLALFLLIPSLILAYPLVSKLISNLYYFQLIAQLSFALLWCTLLRYVDLLFPLEKEAGEQMLKIQDNVVNKGTFRRKDSLANTN